MAIESSNKEIRLGLFREPKIQRFGLKFHLPNGVSSQPEIVNSI